MAEMDDDPKCQLVTLYWVCNWVCMLHVPGPGSLTFPGMGCALASLGLNASGHPWNMGPLSPSAGSDDLGIPPKLTHRNHPNPWVALASYALRVGQIFVRGSIEESLRCACKFLKRGGFLSWCGN